MNEAVRIAHARGSHQRRRLIFGVDLWIRTLGKQHAHHGNVAAQRGAQKRRCPGFIEPGGPLAIANFCIRFHALVRIGAFLQNQRNEVQRLVGIGYRDGAGFDKGLPVNISALSTL